jgi:hypothetical protein
MVVLAVMVVGASACFGSSARTNTAPPSTAQHVESGVLSIRVNLNTCAPALWGSCGPATRRYKLSCTPTTGTMPHPQAACAALADCQAYLKSETGPTYICRGLIGRPTATAVVSGIYAGHHFLLKLDTRSWCAVPMRVMQTTGRCPEHPTVSTVRPRLGLPSLYRLDRPAHRPPDYAGHHAGTELSGSPPRRTGVRGGLCGMVVPV